MSDVTTNKMVQALTKDRGKAGDFGTVGITQQPIVSNPLKGVSNAISSAAKEYYRRERDQQVRDERERKASATRMGGYLAATNQDLPEDAEPETIKTYHTSKFITSSDLAIKELSKTFDDESFQELGVTKQNEIIAQFKENLANEAAVNSVDDNAVAQEYVVAQMRALDTNLAISRDKYNNDTIPRKTISNHVDSLITTNSDKDRWSGAFESFRAEKVRGGMDDTTLNKVIYGETLRATEAGNLNAYDALRESKVYSELSSAQKHQLDSSVRKTQSAIRTKSISDFVELSKSRLKQAMNTADITEYEDIVSDIRKLPADIRTDVVEKMAPSLEKFLPTRDALTKLDMIGSGVRNITMSKDEIETALDYTTMQTMARTATADAEGGTAVPTMSPQEATQVAAGMLSSRGLYHENSQDAFNLQDVTFVDGAPTQAYIQAIAGADNLRAQGLTKDSMRRIMGDDNYAVYAQLNTYRDRGIDDGTAMSRIMANKEAFLDSTNFQKAQKKIKTLEKIDQSGFLESIADTFKDNSLIAHVGESVMDIFDDSDDNKELELYSRAYLDDENEMGSALTDGGVRTISERNRTEATVAFLAFQDKFPDMDEATLLREFKEQLEEDAIIVNSNLIVNEGLRRRLNKVSNDPKIANQRVSRAMQVLTPLVALPKDLQFTIQDSILEVTRVTAEGTELITDINERRKYINDRRRSDDIVVKVNRKKYEELYAKGGTLSDGTTIAPIRSYIEKQAGIFDTRAADTFVQHTVMYDDMQQGFVVSGLDRSGELLTVDKDFDTLAFKEFGKDPEIRAGTPLSGVLPESLVTMYAESFGIDD